MVNLGQTEQISAPTFEQPLPTVMSSRVDAGTRWAATLHVVNETLETANPARVKHTQVTSCLTLG